MATYAKATYNAAKYASNRPTYPRQLFDSVFRFHGQGTNARWGTAVDLGCGPGQATTELTPFRKVIGVDPSAKMIEQAKQHAAAGSANQIEYVQSPAESMPFLPKGSIDMIISAQSGHWFNWSKVWEEAARVLVSGGSLAAWGYSEFRLSRYPSATPLIHEYSQGSDLVNSLGPHWERPGRTILDEHFLAIPDPNTIIPNAFQDFTRVFYTGDHHPHLPNPRPVLLRKKMAWNDLLAYLRTFSALHTYHQKYPGDLLRSDGDIAVRFCKRLQAEVAQHENRSAGSLSDEIDIEWPVALILVRRK